MSFFDDIADWFVDVGEGFQNWIENLMGNGDPQSLGLTFVFVILMAFFLLDDPVNVGMDKSPLAFRIIAIVVFAPICYFIINRMLNK